MNATVMLHLENISPSSAFSPFYNRYIVSPSFSVTFSEHCSVDTCRVSAPLLVVSLCTDCETLQKDASLAKAESNAKLLI